MAAILVIPFLLVLGWKFLSFRLPIVFLLVILVLKVFLFVGAPAGGWLVKIKPNTPIEQFRQGGGFCTYLLGYLPNICETPFHIKDEKWFGGEWAKTYATFWNKEASGILINPWTEKLDFPLDWVIPTFKNYTKIYNELNPIIKIEGSLLLPKENKFAIVAEGLKEGSLIATNENGESYFLLPVKNYAEAAQKNIISPRVINGRYLDTSSIRARTGLLFPFSLEKMVV